MSLKYFAWCALLFSVALGGPAPSRAQDFRVEGRNPPAAPAGAENFTSLDGRFAIALPRQVGGFRGVTFDTPEGKVTAGDAYSWQSEAARYEVSFMDKDRMPGTSAMDVKEVVRLVSEQMAAQVPAGEAKVLSNGELTASGLAGREIRIEFASVYGVTRLLASGDRIYMLTAAARKDPQALDAAVKVLDSFRVLTPAEVEAAARKQAEAAAPAPLPQEPAARRPKSDAEDGGLRGRVKTVYTEREDLSGTWPVQGRKPSSMEHYNELGNLTRSDSYDYKGNLADVTAYGYLDGERVSRIKVVEHGYNPPLIMVAAPGGASRRKDDPRYTYKFKYKYDAAGRLLEKAWHMSDGRLWLRYVYRYKGRQREELAYSDDGSLNQKYLYTLDDKGNEVEQVIYEPRDNSVKAKESYSYEFDAQGNWTKRVTSEWKVKDGKEGFRPSSVDYRTITYH